MGSCVLLCTIASVSVVDNGRCRCAQCFVQELWESLCVFVLPVLILTFRTAALPAYNCTWICTFLVQDCATLRAACRGVCCLPCSCGLPEVHHTDEIMLASSERFCPAQSQHRQACLSLQPAFIILQLMNEPLIPVAVFLRTRGIHCRSRSQGPTTVPHKVEVLGRAAYCVSKPNQFEENMKILPSLISYDQTIHHCASVPFWP